MNAPSGLVTYPALAFWGALARRGVIYASVVANVAAEQVPAWVWMQALSSAGDRADCSITVTKFTPQIVQITSNNGWTGCASYVAKDDRYTGAFQWTPGAVTSKGVLFGLELTCERQTLSLNAKSDPLSFSSTCRRK